MPIMPPASFVSFSVDHETQLDWWEPYRASVRTRVAELRSTGLLNPWSWVRVVGIPALVIGLVIAAMLHVQPGMLVPWRPLISVLIGYSLMFPLLLGLMILAPRHVSLQRNGVVLFLYGQRQVVIPARELRRISLKERPDGELHLSLDYVTRRGARCTRECAVPRTVCRDTLEKLLTHLAEESSRDASTPTRV
jgi:hypothetical protein